MIHKITNREKKFLLITISIIVMSVFFNLFFMPFLVKNKQLNNEINLKRSKLMKYLALISKKQWIQQQYNKFYPANDNYGEIENDINSLLSALQKVAQNSSILINDIRPQHTRNNRAKNFTVDIKTEGTMENYIKFIYILEFSVPFIEMKKISFNAASNGEKLTGIITIINYKNE